MTGWDRIVFRVCSTVTAVLLFDQAVFAGQFLGGSFGALRTHRTNATVAGIGILVTAAAGLVVRLRGGPGWPALASLGMFALTAVQILLGFRRMLTVHIPLGVAIIALMLGLTIWSWRRPTTADTRSLADTQRRTHAPLPAAPQLDRDSGADDRGASGGAARPGTVSGEGAAVRR